jgi:hypothetical protein
MQSNSPPVSEGEPRGKLRAEQCYSEPAKARALVAILKIAIEKDPCRYGRSAEVQMFFGSRLPAGLTQWIFIGFVQSLDVLTVEALLLTSSQAPNAIGVRRTSTAKRRASTADGKRRYLLRQSFAGLAKKSSAGAL